MNRSTFHICLTLLFFSSLQCWSEQNPSPAPQDTKAVSIVRQALDIAGGIQTIEAIADYTATGSITYHLHHEFQGSVTIRGAGLDNLRFDASLPGGIRSEVTTEGEVKLRTEEGAVAVIGSEAPLAPPRFMLPYLLLAPVLGSPGYRISYKGVVRVDGKSAHDIQVRLALPGLGDVNGRHGERFTVDFFIDASTFQVLMMQDFMHERRTRQIRYSDYRVVGGVLVPFSVDQSGGYQPCSIKLDQITFNSGLQVLDFRL
jgi:hypothetical protein